LKTDLYFVRRPVYYGEICFAVETTSEERAMELVNALFYKDKDRCDVIHTNQAIYDLDNATKAVTSLHTTGKERVICCGGW